MTTVKILNVAYPGQAVDLIDAIGLGPISGYVKNHDSHNQSWKIRTIVDNKKNIESVAKPGHYASVRVVDNGVPLSGNRTETTWLQNPVGVNKYQFASEDGRFVWALERVNNYYAVLLKPASTSEDPNFEEDPTTLWTLESDN